MEKNVLVAAIDFSEDFSQICYFDGFMREPESMSTIYNDKRYLIPSVIWFDDDGKRVCYGDEAVKCGKSDKGMMIENLIELFDKKETVSVNGTEYESGQLIEKYFSHMFKLIRENKDMGKPRYVAVTIENQEERMISLLYDILKQEGFPKENVCVISHGEAFLYYGLSREKELFANDVVMFDYNRTYFKYRRFNIVRNRHPQIIDTVEKDFTKDMPYSLMESEEGRKNADSILSEFVKAEFRTHVVSTVYLAGSGFYEEWMQQSMPFICSRRRVFKGYNLFVKGACYAAMEKAGCAEYKDMIFKCGGRTGADIKLVVKHNGSDKELTLSKAGTNWYEAGAKTDCIADGDTEVRFIIDSPISGISRNVSVDLSGFPKRPPKTTRIGITVGYQEENKCVLCVEDKGFGDFFKSSGVVNRKVVDIKEYL
ncbi:MAG: hypothetical protein K2I03_12650 [Lachnospiraceae bacterium]|nr:hypothetical protein [Lachnospiraceae bacterium]MDE6233392.1 hypothetical protein [Lachnospiraceae bacterium]MDE6253273.1 hypothetical protein [Lachnospiraceae bacterium]